MSLGVWLAFYVVLSFLIGRLFASFVGWKFARLGFFPGVLLAALGRSLACIVTGTEAKKCDCWRKAGPETKGAPPGGSFFRVLFALGPFLLAIVGVLVAEWALGRPVSFDEQLPRIAAAPVKAGETIWTTWVEFASGLFNALSAQRLGDARFWIFIYLAASFVVGCAPNLEDLKAIAAACGLVAVVSIVCEFLGVEVVLHSLYDGRFWRGFSLLVAYAIFVLVVSGVLFLPLKLLRDSRKEK